MVNISGIGATNSLKYLWYSHMQDIGVGVLSVCDQVNLVLRLLWYVER